MAKKYQWEITESTVNEQGDPITVGHTVSLLCSNLTGKAIVTIDGDEFDISVRPFGLRKTSQSFRLGDSAAILEFPKSGAPVIVIEGQRLESGASVTV